jgi:hypothetical protein
MSVAQGVLSINDAVAGGLNAGDINGNGSSTVVLTGSIAEINATLANATGLVYQANLDFNGADTLAIDANDLGNTGAGGPRMDQDVVAISITAVNDAPANTVPGIQTTNEDAALEFSSLGANAITISDVDVGTASILVTLGVTNGSLSLNGAALGSLTFINGDGTDDAQMSFTGALDDINDALNGMTFDPDTDYFGLAMLDIESNDLGNSGGGQLIAADSVSINIDSVNDAPVVSVPAPQATPVNTPLEFATDTNPITISDVDAGTGLIQLTLTVANGAMTLSTTNGLSFTTGDGTDDSVMVFQGTLSNINNALDGLFFNPDLGFVGSVILDILVDDLGNAGLGGFQTGSGQVLINVG